MFKKVTPLLLAVSLLFGAAACGNSDVSKSKFQSELEKKAGLPAAQAKCVSDKVYKELPQKDINKIYTADNEKDLDPKVVKKFTDLVVTCTR